MKLTNKILTGVFAILLVASFGIVWEVVKEAELSSPLVIQRQTTKAGLDSLQQEITDRGGSLKWTEVRFNDQGELNGIAGEASGYGSHLTFNTDNLNTVKIWIGALQTRVNVDSKADNS